MKESEFYAVGEKEILYAKNPEDAVIEFIENSLFDQSPSDLPKFVEVQGYIRMEVDDRYFEQLITLLLEELDENYAGEDPSKYFPSNEAMKHFDQFKKLVKKEYPVWNCEKNGEPIVMSTAPFLDD